MRRKLITGLISAAILFGTSSGAGAAAGSITMEAIGTVPPGGSIVIKGTPVTTEVLVQIFRPNQSLLLTDLLSAAEYEAGRTYSLPADTAGGTYAVLAGSSRAAAKTTFLVQSGQGADSGSSGPSSGSTSPAPQEESGKEAGKRRQVTMEEVKKLLKGSENGGGGRILRLEAGAQGVQFPADALRSVGDFQVEVHKGGTQVAIPHAVLAQLAALVPAETLGSAQLVLHMEQVEAGKLARLLEEGGKRSRAAVRAAGGEGYDLSLSILTADGRNTVLSSFAAPVTLRLPYDPAHNADLLGVYHLGTDGSLNYAGGRPDGAVVTAQVSHFSSYAVLEFNRTFEDVPASHWASSVIRAMAARHLIEGVTDSDFAPDREVTRAELAAMLVRALGLQGSAAGMPFRDVPESAWHAHYIRAAFQHGIIGGRTATEFAPDAPVTREEMAVMLMRAHAILVPGASTEPATADFSDHSLISPWAAADVDRAYAAGLITGVGEGQFMPQGLTTRAQSAQVIYRLLQAH